MSFIVRPIEKEEAPTAAKIEKLCLSTAWSEKQISESSDNPSSHYLVALLSNKICGIVSFYCLCGECQLINIAVDQAYRSMGVATELMKAMHKIALSCQCENITLEVAEDNLMAIALYKNFGYTAVGRRKGFYHGTDAIIMEFRF